MWRCDINRLGACDVANASLCGIRVGHQCEGKPQCYCIHLMTASLVLCKGDGYGTSVEQGDNKLFLQGMANIRTVLIEPSHN